MWVVCVIPAPERTKQEDAKFEASLGYTGVPSHSGVFKKNPSQNSNKNIHCYCHSDRFTSSLFLPVVENVYSVLTDRCS